MVSAIMCGTVGWLARHGSKVLERPWMRWCYDLVALITLILVVVGDATIGSQDSGLGVAGLTAIASCAYQIRGAVILRKARNREPGTPAQERL